MARGGRIRKIIRTFLTLENRPHEEMCPLPRLIYLSSARTSIILGDKRLNYPMEKKRVTATILNVRERGTVESTIVGELKRGEVVNVLGSSGAWIRIQKEGLEGWAFGKYLTQAEAIARPSFVTYKIVSDLDGKLKECAKISCNFWNRYICPRIPIVMRLGTFTDSGSTIACSYKPYNRNEILYGMIEFNTNFLVQFNNTQVIGTIVHELGHTLGFGWDDWLNLFSHTTGTFRQEYITAVPALKYMRAETHYGPGTTYSHWDEDSPYKNELMTGFKDSAEFVLPVTIDVMKLLGHEIRSRLTEKQLLADIIDEVANIQFQRIEEAKSLDKDYYEPTEVWERVFSSMGMPIANGA
jgi:hypothetical protein